MESPYSEIKDSYALMNNIENLNRKCSDSS
jgi:hypothetical protein